jgi:hypothetical protein
MKEKRTKHNEHRWFDETNLMKKKKKKKRIEAHESDERRKKKRIENERD